jgi:hypothetical protein
MVVGVMISFRAEHVAFRPSDEFLAKDRLVDDPGAV